MSDSSATNLGSEQGANTAGEWADFIFRGPFRKAYEARFSEDFDGRVVKMMQSGDSNVCAMLIFIASYLDNLAPAVTPQDDTGVERR